MVVCATVSLIMAAGDYDERARQCHALNHNIRDGHLRPNLHIDVKENMKQVGVSQVYCHIRLCSRLNQVDHVLGFISYPFCFRWIF